MGLKNLKKWLLMTAAVLLATPIFGSTFYGGLEDWTGLDYDYNDVVFSISGNNLTLHSNGQWYAEPVLGTGGAPFWNRSSFDGANYNVGYCIYGGGSCNGGAALQAGAKYLATNPTSLTGSANEVTFTADGKVVLNIATEVTAASDSIGWYSLSDPNTIHWLSQNSFDPNGEFGLVGGNRYYTYYSQTSHGGSSPDDVSHFAFFDDPPAAVPEPGAMGLLSWGLIGSSVLLWRRKRR